MDRRTLLIVLTLTVTLFLVNNYFEQQRINEWREYQTQQKVAKALKQQKLELDISDRTAKESELPFVNLDEGHSGIEANGTVLTLAWPNLPETIDKYSLKVKADPGNPAIYQTSSATPMKITSLPHFGAYELQLVALPSRTITLGEYVDGQLFITSEELQRLKEDSAQLPVHPPAIALLKSDDKYVPVAWYNGNQLLPLEKEESLQNYVKFESLEKNVPVSTKKDEQFYVLENAFQQLVFSNYGGALAEINLPFHDSPVKPIDIDRDMVEHHPYNAHFPAHPYFTTGMVKHETGTLGGYYPLIRRDLIQSSDRKSMRVSPKFYALNVVSGEFEEIANLIYEVKEFTQDKIVFETRQPHRRITKTYTLANDKAPYSLDLTIQIEGDSRNLWLSSGVPEVEWISGSPAPSLKLRTTRKGQVNVEELSLPNDPQTVSSIFPDWLSNSNGFFGVILNPLNEIGEGYQLQYVSGNEVPSRLVEVDQEYQLFSPEKMPGYLALLPLNKKGGKMEFRIFAGPFSTPVLKAVDAAYSDSATGYTPDYIATQTFHGWFAFISEPFAKFLMILMNFFHFLTGSWGFSIILLTIALRIMMYPLNAWSTKSMLKMQELSPKMTKLQEKHKGDSKRLQQEMMNLYREAGANPLSGCLPLLIQMPFLIGMFGLLRSTFELRGASFIPGWIDDLAAPDVVFSWGYPIFFIGNEFHLLPILLGAVMLLQQNLMSTLPKDPKQWTDQQRQQRAMGNIMALMFTFLFYSFPSGLNIYWLFSMLLGILQQWWTSKRMKLT